MMAKKGMSVFSQMMCINLKSPKGARTFIMER